MATPSGEVRLDRTAPERHARRVLESSLLGGSSTWFAFSATAVACDGVALVLAGTKGSGRTELAVELARRGFEWVSGDVVVFDRAERVAWPIACAFRPHLSASARLVAGGNDSVASEVACGLDDGGAGPTDGFPMVRSPVRVGCFVILEPASGAYPSTTRFEIHFFENARPAALSPEASTFDDASAISLTPPSPLDPGAPWTLESSDPLAVYGWIERHRDAVLSVERPAACRGPSTAVTPSLERIPPFRAALALTRDLRNRGPDDRIGREYGGREHELAIDVAEAVRDAETYALTPGPAHDTAAILERCFARAAR